MKPVVVVFGLFVMLAVHVTAQDELNSLKNKCKRKTGITEAAMNNIKVDQVPRTRKEQCFIGCMSHELGIVFPNNKINVEHVELLLGSISKQNPQGYQRLLKIVKDCASKVAANSDDCAAAKKNMECFVGGLQMMG